MGWQTYRQALGLPALLARAWGAWERVGERLRNRGWCRQRPAQALGSGADEAPSGSWSSSTLPGVGGEPRQVAGGVRPRQVFGPKQRRHSSGGPARAGRYLGATGSRSGLPGAIASGSARDSRDAAVLKLVRTHAAAVLGHESIDGVEPDRAFQELGFDSLAAVELRKRLDAATDLRLPSTLIFDYPSARALAKFLRSEAEGERRGAAALARPATSAEEPIAIVGMGCRYPGGVGSPDELWSLLAEGGDAITVFPGDRVRRLEDLHRPGVANHGFAPKGGFVLDAGHFDPGFFGISPREASVIDPQQRLLLETAWEALEDAVSTPICCVGASLAFSSAPAPVITYTRSVSLQACRWLAPLPASPPAASPTPSGSRARR